MKFLPPRKKDSHKGDYGRILVISGSLRYPGAPVLAVSGALRSGAGLVSAAIPMSLYEVITSRMPPEAIILPYPDGKSSHLSTSKSVKFIVNEIFSAQNHYDAILIGPGLGVSEHIVTLIAEILSLSEKKLSNNPSFKQPILILDADALNSLARYSTLVREKRILNLFSPDRIAMTPHPGEAARLLGIVNISSGNRFSTAKQIARKWKCVCVLKCHQTIVTDGYNKVYVNKKTGNPGMATGGSGDVLSGIIAAFSCIFKRDIFNAASLGVFIHGLSGDIAVSRLTETSVIATDIVRFIPDALIKAKEIFRTKKSSTRKFHFINKKI